MKKFKGFTLIELIVVIAIIGVLAAILVPAMMGWVRKASINSANTNAKQVYTAAQTYMQELETQGCEVSNKKFSYKSDDKLNSGTREIKDIINDGITTSGNGIRWAFSVGAEDKANIVLGAIFATGSKYTGGYPNNAPTTVANAWGTGDYDAKNLEAAGKTKTGTNENAGPSAWDKH